MEENKNKIEAETNFNDILNDPLRLFGAIYPYFIVLIIVGGLFWLNSYGTASLNELKATNLPDYTPKELEMKKATMMEGVDINVVSVPNDELLAKGEELYKANCASCHGNTGLGDGIAGASLNPLPRNFTDPNNWKNGRKLSEMYVTLEEGIAGTGMVAYEYLPVMDRFAMIHFVHSLMSDYPENTPEELVALDERYSLSAGKMTNNQIPLSLALEKFQIEQNRIGYNVKSLNLITRSYTDDLGFQLFNNLTYNTEKALILFSNSSVWRQSPENLMQVLASTYPDNSFKASALRLSNEDAALLYNYLLRIIPAESI
jgi:hypothetical protein